MARKIVADPTLLPSRSRGGVVCYWSDKWQTYIVRRRPRSAGTQTAKRRAAQATFAKVNKAITSATALEANQARAYAKNKPFNPRDLLFKAAYGTLFEWTDNTGTVWKGLRVMQQTIEQLLDSITTIVGSILVRTADGWMALGIGDANEVLTVDPVSGLPAWQPASGGGGGGGKPKVFGVVDGNTWSSFGAGYISCRPVVIPAGSTLDEVAWLPRTTGSSDTWEGVIYADSDCAPGALLDATGAQTGITSGVQASATFSTGFTASSDTLVWLGVSFGQSTALLCNAYAGRAYFSGSVGSPPSTAGSITHNNYGFSVWGRDSSA